MAIGAPQRQVRDITGMLNRAGHVLAIQLAAALADVGLTPRMQCVLVHALEQERTQAELAALADLDKSTMVATADELERLGFAQRVPSPTDRRARLIVVTPAGRKAANTGQRIVDRVHEEVLAGVGAKDRASFIQILATLTQEDVATLPDADISVRRRRQPAH